MWQLRVTCIELWVLQSLERKKKCFFKQYFVENFHLKVLSFPLPPPSLWEFYTSKQLTKVLPCLSNELIWYHIMLSDRYPRIIIITYTHFFQIFNFTLRTHDSLLHRSILHFEWLCTMVVPKNNTSDTISLFSQKNFLLLSRKISKNHPLIMMTSLPQLFFLPLIPRQFHLLSKSLFSPLENHHWITYLETEHRHFSLCLFPSHPSDQCPREVVSNHT